MSWAATVLTLFPEMFPGALGVSLVGKALEKNLWSLEVRDIREHGIGKHRTVDDTPAGGGPGMVMRADVAVAAIDAVEQGGRPLPQGPGRRFRPPPAQNRRARFPRSGARQSPARPALRSGRTARSRRDRPPASSPAPGSAARRAEKDRSAAGAYLFLGRSPHRWQKPPRRRASPCRDRRRPAYRPPCDACRCRDRGCRAPPATKASSPAPCRPATRRALRGTSRGTA